MLEWFDKVVNRVTPDDPKPIIALDPHGILDYPEVENQILERGFPIHRLSEGLELRFAFELEGRNHHRIIFCLRSERPPLPDIAEAARIVHVDFHELFPNLDSKALEGLSFNALCTIDHLRVFESMGYEKTLRFLLENLYQVDFVALNTHMTKERLLAVLIAILFHEDVPNRAILQFLYSMVQTVFGKSSFESLVEKKSLGDFLQREWESHARGTSNIYFSDPLLEKQLNQLFLKNILHSVAITQEQLDVLGTGKHLGYQLDKDLEQHTRFEQLVSFIEERVTTIENQHNDWRQLAPVLGELGFLADEMDNKELMERYENAMTRLNNRFQIFIQNGYGSLHSTQGRRDPIVVHHILEYLRVQSQGRIALVVLDGMSVIQWHMISRALEAKGLVLRELACLAWIPSITAWSRQALLRGGRPDLNTDNSKEKELFLEFWRKNGKSAYEVSYSKFGYHQSADMPGSDITAAAFVCNDLDELMHGATLDTRQLHQNTQLWIEKSGFVDFVSGLRERGFTIGISTDHGNIKARGIGNLGLSDRQLTKSRSKRHLECVSRDDAERFKKEHPELALGVSGPSVYLCDGSAFTSDRSLITHGGSHLLEVIIPLGVIE